MTLKEILLAFAQKYWTKNTSSAISRSSKKRKYDEIISSSDSENSESQIKKRRKKGSCSSSSQNPSEISRLNKEVSDAVSYDQSERDLSQALSFYRFDKLADTIEEFAKDQKHECYVKEHYDQILLYTANERAVSKGYINRAINGERLSSPINMDLYRDAHFLMDELLGL